MLMNWICSIPGHIGWMLVGSIFGTLCAVMLWKLGCLFVQMWKEWHEPDEEEECEG